MGTILEFDEELAKAELRQLSIICLHNIRHAHNTELLKHFVKKLDELRIYAESEIRRIRTEQNTACKNK